MNNENNNQDPIIGVYQLVVFASGKIETIQKPLDSIFQPFDFDIPIFHPSSRTNQVISIIQKVTTMIEKKDIKLQSLDIEILNKLISKACYDVANEFNVTIQTTYDKLSRQLGLTKEQFSGLLVNFLQGTSKEKSLKDTLLEHSSKNNKNDDYDFIEFSLKKISEQLKNCRQ